jgi:hypothetical protein
VTKKYQKKEEKVYTSFSQEYNEKCQLTGQEFAEDAMYVLNIIQSRTGGEAELWIQ